MSPTIRATAHGAISAKVEGPLGLATLGTGIDRPAAMGNHQPALPDHDREPVVRPPPSAIICEWCQLTPSMDEAVHGGGFWSGGGSSTPQLVLAIDC